LVAAVAAFPLVIVDGVEVLLLPMLPAQLLWINLVAAVTLALPLAFEAKERNLMARAPRDPKEPILTRFVLMRTGLVALLMAAGAIGVFVWEYKGELPRMGHETAMREAQTLTVTSVILFQICYLFNCRSLHHSVLVIGLFSNPTIYVGIAALLLAQAGFIYLPVFQQVFGTAALDVETLAVAAAVGVSILPIVGLEKWLRSR
jgi:magnesium-transporting ATPase (P-type)